MHQSGMRRVDVVIYPGFYSLEAVGPLAVFDHANEYLKLQGRMPAYTVSFAAAQLGWVQSDSIVRLEATRELDGQDLPDIALIVGTRSIDHALADGEVLVRWLREHGRRIRRLASMCSGGFFLAEAGLLNGKRATTHWNEARAMQDRYPQVEVDAQPMFVRSGNIYTSAGVTSGMDLALAILEDELGREVALNVARDLAVCLKQHDWHSQLSMHLSSQISGDPTFRELQEWILSSLNQPLHVERLASQVGMTTDLFAPKFLAQTGVPYQEFVETARFELARALMEDSIESPHVVALRCGLVSVEQMDGVFVRRMGITAVEVRERCARRRNKVRSNDLEF